MLASLQVHVPMSGARLKVIRMPLLKALFHGLLKQRAHETLHSTGQLAAVECAPSPHPAFLHALDSRWLGLKIPVPKICFGNEPLNSAQPLSTHPCGPCNMPRRRVV